VGVFGSRSRCREVVWRGRREFGELFGAGWSKGGVLVDGLLSYQRRLGVLASDGMELFEGLLLERSGMDGLG
jgi:hypothetical protein